MPEEIKQEVVLKTQKCLGKYVKKPPLSDKLLKKPPFRFLHDVIKTVIKETGFLEGLYSEEELNSENVKEKDSKVAFLSKLIDAVKIITNTDLAVRPSKIVAGLEPTDTNLLLQAIGKAIEKKVDSSEYIKQLNSGQIINNDKNKKSKKISDKNENIKKPAKAATNDEGKVRTTTKKIEKQSSNDTPKSTNRDKTKTKRTPKDTKSKADSDDNKTKPKEKSKKKEKSKDSTGTLQTTDRENKNPVKALDSVNDINKINEKNIVPTTETISDVNSNRSILDEEINKTSIEPSIITTLDTSDTTINNENRSDNEPRKRSTSASRPKSARPRSGDLRDKHSEELKEPLHIQSRPKSSLRPPSVRPSSARPGAPRLRPDSALPVKEVVPMGKINVIVESFDKEDEEETVIIQSNPDAVEEHTDTIADVPGDNKGHLVEQILEQINESEANKTSLTGIGDKERQKETFYGKDSAAKETSNLKSLIQSLTKAANPLGKLLNYLHEDIDAMQAELESWTHTKRQLFDEIAKQKKISTEMNKPLVLQLEHLNREIKKLEEELVNTRNTILRNDVKIKELLSK